MPNHVVNRLKIVGTAEQVKAVRDAVVNTVTEKDDISGKEETYTRLIDFSKIIPMADSLSLTCDGLVMMLENQFMSSMTMNELLKRLRESDEKSVENFAKAIVNVRKYGSASWYDWSVKNWGTKWNAYSQVDVEPNLIQFETAWSMPEPVMIQLSKMFPDVKFELEYADEDIGSNCGMLEIQNGVVNDVTPFEMQSEEARRFACKLHDWDYNELYSEENEEE